MTPGFTLHTDRLTLRPVAASDLPAWVALLASPRSASVGGPLGATQAYWMLCRALGHWQMRGYGDMSVLRHGDGVHVGNVSVEWPEGAEAPELGWTLGDGHEGRGYATEAAARLREHAQDVLGLRGLVSAIAADNARSVRVAERLGAVRTEGRLSTRPGAVVWRHPEPWAAPAPRRMAGARA
jgi:RimJ/RimL family protein N-acetyltransferase